MGEYIPPSGKNPLSSLAIPTPSPQTYSPHLLPSGRCISILGKHPDSQSQVTGPGPQKYNTDPIKVVFEEAPKWSMQGKERKQVKVVDDACPGPGKYDVKTSVGKGSPSFSMSGWQPVFEPIIPSPQTYYPTAAIGRTGAPQYSFGIKPLDGHEISPGPQDYTIPRVPPHARSSPHCTFRPPSKELPVREDEPSPAPNAYYPRASWNQKSATLKGCYKESKVTMKTPGPANYLMPNDLFTGPQFSISAKNAGDLSVANKPGPADYKPSFDLTRDQGPAVTLKGRHESRDGLSAKSIPGPGAYTPRDRQLRGNDGPKVTIKGRRKELAECTPGPADYQTTPVVTPAQLARYDAKEKDKLRVIVEKPKPNPTPGPGSYTLTPLDKTKAAGPKYSLRKRLDHLLKYSTTMKSPGPNAYQAVDVLTPRATTFKSRMSPYVTVFPSTRIDTLQVKV
ncbi:hypothetical protein DFS34DRAFT_709045 [Phlyctochytrium arcticum]|nr:hypothetical protein DFS34DRAFT_709045 [Phlyctochytrium arcticum]